jgi:hypothetical protein
VGSIFFENDLFHLFKGSNMYFCIYASSASSPLADHDLMSIKEKSKKETEKLDVTGLLVFHRNNFIHYYEGEKSAVGKIVSSIEKDKRHNTVKPIAEGTVKERQFPNTSMELRVLDKDPLFTSSDLSNDAAGIKKIINSYFMNIT